MADAKAKALAALAKIQASLGRSSLPGGGTPAAAAASPTLVASTAGAAAVEALKAARRPQPATQEDVGEWPMPAGGFRQAVEGWPPANDIRYGARILAVQRMPGFTRHDIVVRSREIMIRKLVGPGGEQMKALTTRTGAFIFAIDHEAPPTLDPESRVAVLVGKPAQLAHATAEIESTISGPGTGAADVTSVLGSAAGADPNDPNEPAVPVGHFRLAWLLPREGVGQIVGRGGSNIQKLVSVLPTPSDLPCHSTPYTPRCPHRPATAREDSVRHQGLRYPNKGGR